MAQKVKNLPAMKETWFNPGLGKSPGEENDNSFHYSCLENSVGRGPWWATVHGGHKIIGHDLAIKQQHQ